MAQKSKQSMISLTCEGYTEINAQASQVILLETFLYGVDLINKFLKNKDFTSLIIVLDYYEEALGTLCEMQEQDDNGDSYISSTVSMHLSNYRLASADDVELRASLLLQAILAYITDLRSAFRLMFEGAWDEVDFLLDDYDPKEIDSEIE